MTDKQITRAIGTVSIATAVALLLGYQLIIYPHEREKREVDNYCTTVALRAGGDSSIQAKCHELVYLYRDYLNSRNGN